MKNSNHLYTNSLIHETSPYLLQHAHNPVNWYAWNNETLEKAIAEDKPLLISIGYAACHWCHVMEHESFENEEIAQLMNDNFICIKVDREERPDIDAVYMNAVQLLTGRGGWPLNCFALPNGKPFYGGTYFQPSSWIHTLESLMSIYKNDRQKVITASEEITQGVNSMDIIIDNTQEPKWEKSMLSELKNKILGGFDLEIGGLKGAPKFPLPGLHQSIVTYNYFSPASEIENYSNIFLQKIASGGMYDVVGGGFARYAVDAQWIVPHFEKMLYDNAQLISLYSKAYMLDSKDEYKQIVKQTIGFIEKELQAPEGIFYSSLDADSEGEEGKYYVWEYDEFKELAGADADILIEYFNIKKKGNWEGSGNILHTTQTEAEITSKHKISHSDFQHKKQIFLNFLFEKRKNRIKPGLDDKSITTWNALMISALADAYWAFDEPEYLQRAQKAADFMIENHISNGYDLFRNYKNGKLTIPAFADDYASLIEAMLKLYSVSFEPKYLTTAKHLTDKVLENFYDSDSGFIWFTSNTDKPLFTRKMELSDNVTPSSNAVFANSLLQLSEIYYNQRYADIAQRMLLKIQPHLMRIPAFHFKWFETLIEKTNGYKLLVICGNEALEILSGLKGKYLPGIIIAGAKTAPKLAIPAFENRFVKGKTYAYICSEQVCGVPVESADEIVLQLNIKQDECKKTS